MKQTNERQQKILDNMNLVRYFLRRFGISPYAMEYDDVFQIGVIGLIKAVDTFDESRENAFSTYASKCIENEMVIYFKKNKKYQKDVSMQSVVATDTKGNDVTLEDILEDTDSKFYEELVEKENFQCFVNTILNYLTLKEIVIIFYRISNVTFEKISDIFDKTKQNVQQKYKKSILNVQKKLKSNAHCEEMFSINLGSNTYKFSFKFEDFYSIEQAVEIINKLVSNKISPKIEKNISGKYLTLELSRNLDAFAFIASIIKEMNDQNLKFLNYYNKTKKAPL